MIEQVDGRLRAWVQSVLDGVDCTLSAPGAEKSGRGVSLYLLELAAMPPLRERKRPPLQFMAHYLVTTWADEPEEAHRLLGRLVFAAMDSPDMDVAFDPLPPAAWQAFGLPPQPSFILHAPVRLERPDAAVPLVRQPLVLQTSPLVELQGVVIGPDDLPIAGARVELPALQRVTYAGPKGEFRFTGLPGEGQLRQVRIVAKGKTLDVTLGQLAISEPLVIRFDPFPNPPIP
ncbi:MAG: Pvc16 family protein [Chloroflexota bacterium]